MTRCVECGTTGRRVTDDERVVPCPDCDGRGWLAHPLGCCCEDCEGERFARKGYDV